MTPQQNISRGTNANLLSLDSAQSGVSFGCKHMFAQTSPCSCAEEAMGAWKHLGGMEQVSLDTILVASAQTIDFSARRRNCQCCPAASEVEETVLQILGKLIDLLEESITAYATPGNSLAIYASTGQQSHNDSLALQSRGVFQTGNDKNARGRPSTLCVPSNMSLGEHELDEQQSRYLAHDLIARTLKNLVGTLQKMREERVGGEELNEAIVAGASADVLFSRAIRLLSTASTVLIE